MASVALLWLRRDLRITDHPALAAALESANSLVPVFCLDPGLLQGRHRSGSRTQFLLECLRDVDGSLRELGSRLTIRHGPPRRELPALARELGARQVHVTADVGPYARHRDREVRDALAGVDCELSLHPGLFAVDDPAAIRTAAGQAYTVFTPYHRVWSRAPRRDVLGNPRSLPAPPSRLRPGRIPSLVDLGLEQTVSDPAPGGEHAGRETLSSFLSDRIGGYRDLHDTLADGGTSMLSPYLHFGCLSAREIEHRLPVDGGAGTSEFHRQLCWREFYAQVLRSFPGNARSEHQARYRGMSWSRSRRRFDAWCEGRTGYPIVDAAMRQLRREGWMHNRGRLIVGSFLTKDLGVDWRWGERWFMRLLLDGDEANNNGNWQWVASVGVDPQPPSRRIFNPARQFERFDPDGVYVRRYVPELERVPVEYLAEPWTMPDSIQQDCGCVIGRDYPEPIVDHAQARRDALARYAAVR
jgi:deoxyribodipyrimidine photo-lyase